MGSAIQKDGTQLQNNNFDSFQAFTFIKQSDNMASSFVGKCEHLCFMENSIVTKL